VSAISLALVLAASNAPSAGNFRVRFAQAEDDVSPLRESLAKVLAQKSRSVLSLLQCKRIAQGIAP